LYSITTYIIVFFLFGGLVYFAYLAFFPSKLRKFKKRKVVPASSDSTTASASGAATFQEEWIPEHHLKRGRRKVATLNSGGELSGSEASGTEGRKRKGKK